MLPIDPHLPKIVAALARQNLVLVADPGAGKTTRVPAALLDSSLGGEGEIWVVEPRRVAARMAAGFVAAGLGEPLGGRVGFEVRFERAIGPETRVRFLTDGILARRFIDEPELPRAAVVVLDEFHERRLALDVALLRLLA